MVTQDKYIRILDNGGTTDSEDVALSFVESNLLALGEVVLQGSTPFLIFILAYFLSAFLQIEQS